MNTTLSPMPFAEETPMAPRPLWDTISFGPIAAPIIETQTEWPVMQGTTYEFVGAKVVRRKCTNRWSGGRAGMQRPQRVALERIPTPVYMEVDEGRFPEGPAGFTTALVEPAPLLKRYPGLLSALSALMGAAAATLVLYP